MSKKSKKEGMDENKRGKNFTMYEKNLLVDYVGRNKLILENKQTDATTNDLKASAWESITVSYNAANQSGIRTSKQLKELYKVLKKNARNNKNEDRIELVKTGGGTFKTKSTDVDLKVQELCKNQFDPDENPFDDSAILFDDDITVNDQIMEVSHHPDDLPNSDNYYLPIVVEVPAAKTTSDPSFQVPKASPPKTNLDQRVASTSTSNLSGGTVGKPSASWPKKQCSAAEQKRKQVSIVADTMIQRKKIKNSYDEATQNEKLKILEEKVVLLDTGKEIKKKDLELKNQEKVNQEILFKKKLEILKIEADIKLVELETKKFEKNLREMEYKLKLKEYEKLPLNNF